MIASWHDILDESSPAFMARLEKLCRLALTNALLEWDVGAALFAQRELTQGRDPAQTLARRVRAQAKRTPAPPRAPAPPGPPPLPNPDYDPLDALVQRSACGLRQAVVLEQAILTGAARQTGVAATMAAARKALALKRGAAPSLPRRARSRCGMGLLARACHRRAGRARPGRHGRRPAPDPRALTHRQSPGSAQSRLTVSKRRRSLPPPGHLGGARSASGLRQGVSRSCQRACSSSS